MTNNRQNKGFWDTTNERSPVYCFDRINLIKKNEMYYFYSLTKMINLDGLIVLLYIRTFFFKRVPNQTFNVFKAVFNLI